MEMIKLGDAKLNNTRNSAVMQNDIKTRCSTYRTDTDFIQLNKSAESLPWLKQAIYSMSEDTQYDYKRNLNLGVFTFTDTLRKRLDENNALRLKSSFEAMNTHLIKAIYTENTNKLLLPETTVTLESLTENESISTNAMDIFVRHSRYTFTKVLKKNEPVPENNILMCMSTLLTSQQQFMVIPSLSNILFALYTIIEESKQYAILIPTTWFVSMYYSTEFINSCLLQKEQICPEYLLYAPAYMQKRTHANKLTDIDYLESKANYIDKNEIIVKLDSRLPAKMQDTLYTLFSYKLSYSYRHLYRTYFGQKTASNFKAIAC